MQYTDSVDIHGPSSGRIGRISWGKKSNWLQIFFKLLKKDEKSAWNEVQCVYLGEKEFSKLMSMRNYLMSEIDELNKREMWTNNNTASYEMEHVFGMCHKVFDLHSSYVRRTCITFKMYQPSSLYVQIRVFGRKNDEDPYTQYACTNYTENEFRIMMSKLASMYDTVINNAIYCADVCNIV